MNQLEITEELKAFLQREFPNQGVDLTETTDLLGASRGSLSLKRRHQAGRYQRRQFPESADSV